MIFEKAPAKINLTLDVLYKRDDGYHEIEMIMTSIDLADRLTFEKTNDPSITIVSEKRYVPNDQRNLAYQGVALMREKFGIQSGVKITIDKQIPVAAGLAGGSSNAAAALRGMNRLFNLGQSTEQLQKIGEEIGSDVPFCVSGKTAIARGRGEKLSTLPSPPPCWVVLAKPNIGVSTKDVYGNVNVDQIEHPDTESMANALRKKDFQSLCNHLENVLEPITVAMHQEVHQIKTFMQKQGLEGVLMSGSGPTVYGLTEHLSKAERTVNGLRGFCQEVYLVRALTD